MKGVILAGGLGTRLLPLTKITNKHLLPVFNRPMILYPIECLRKAGITDILIVTGGNSAGDFLRLLENGDELGVTLSYAYQRGEGGIADALRLAERFAGKDPICVVLGDNIIERNVKDTVDAFKARGNRGACILLKEVEDPERFGVALRDGQRITKIIEKPKDPPSNLAVIGIYLYDNDVFRIIRGLKPSARGELEITDVNNAYIGAGTMTYGLLQGWWTDAGTFESLLRASRLVAEGGANKGE
ncbi:MAG TPA: sugar phosphate nucleotidyltransferase [Planctomycetota bacterium]|nr:sugar phosphate nucleotidyltransferase [Planctomycetota bacterium]